MSSYGAGTMWSSSIIFPRGKRKISAGVRKKIDFRAESITDLAAVQSASKGADYVIHLAARTSVPRSVENPLDTNSVNIDGTLNVLVAARDAKVTTVRLCRVFFGVRRDAYSAENRDDAARADFSLWA